MGVISTFVVFPSEGTELRQFGPTPLYKNRNTLIISDIWIRRITLQELNISL